jgi:hypothetical protein
MARKIRVDQKKDIDRSLVLQVFKLEILEIDDGSGCYPTLTKFCLSLRTSMRTSSCHSCLEGTSRRLMRWISDGLQNFKLPLSERRSIGTLPHLTKIELILQTKPFDPLLEHENKDNTQATHKQDKHIAQHRDYTCVL